VLAAFKKRSKALSRSGSTLECTPVKEIVDGRESERGRTDVTIDYRVDAARVTLRIHAWGDRWVWIDARRSSKAGWVWEFTAEGRFVASNGAREFVERAEATISASYLPDTEVSAAMRAIWLKCLATGPRRV
jgi:hypothetical protein